jgi:hypothetical protein
MSTATAAKSLVAILPALALLAACTTQASRPNDVVIVAPPALPGALGAPVAPGTEPPMAGSTVPPNTPMRLSAAEISATLSNNTVQGVSANGLGYASFFTATGEERFREGSFNDTGTWRVLPDGRFCSTLTRLSGNAEECYILYRSGTTLTFQRPDGITVGNVTVVAGDPLSL